MFARSTTHIEELATGLTPCQKNLTFLSDAPMRTSISLSVYCRSLSLDLLIALMAVAAVPLATTPACAEPPPANSFEVIDAFPGLTFVDPISMSFEPDNRRFLVASAGGLIYSYEANGDPASKQLVLDISTRVKRDPRDGGLKSFALHPEYGQPGSSAERAVFVHYRYDPDLELDGLQAYNRVSRFHLVAGNAKASADSEVVLIQQFDRHNWHDGGDMVFGHDGYLYISTGDEGAGRDRFNSMSGLSGGLFGGVLRIDVDNDPMRSHAIRRQPSTPDGIPDGWPRSFTDNYGIPNNNPWADPNGARLEEFWAYGLRAPHRMTVDKLTGEIWVGDVGEMAYEEINLVTSGGNYQWPYAEGNAPGPKPVPEKRIGIDRAPVWSYGRKLGQAVIGGYVYRGQRFADRLYGKYIFADHLSLRIWSLQRIEDGSPVVTQIATMPEGGYGASIASFAEDNQGEIYLLKWNGFNQDGGQILTLVRPPG